MDWGLSIVIDADFRKSSLKSREYGATSGTEVTVMPSIYAKHAKSGAHDERTVIEYGNTGCA